MLPGFSSDRYELIELIGSGAIGLVFRAWDRVAHRYVALKSRRRADPEDLFRIKREFRSLARIAHPNLVRLYELVADDEQCFFTMELIENGLPFPEHVQTRMRAPTPGGADGLDPTDGHVDEVALRGVLRQLAEALQTLHDAEMLHRDVKPTNVLVDAANRVALLDFGLLGELATERSRMSMQASFVGTLAYMSPEQMEGRELSPASDWYSLGVLLYESLVGRSPFADASPVELIDRRRLEIPAPTSLDGRTPPELSNLAMRLLAHDAGDRPGIVEILAVVDASAPWVVTHPVRERGRPTESVFVDRDVELERLGEALDVMRAGRVAAVTVEGPSGIGKTGLIRRFLETQTKDELLLRSRCYPYQAVPFEALDEAVDELSRYLVVQSRARVEALMPAGAHALQRVFPVLGRVRSSKTPSEGSLDAAPHEVRRQGFLALRELLVRISERQSIIVWIDDMQWSDADSEPLLRALMRPPDAPRILWIFSFRSEERGESPILVGIDPLLESIPEVARFRLSLGPLSEADSRQLVERLAPEHAPGIAALDRIAAESGGSPFLLGEMVRQPPLGERKTPEDFAFTLSERLRALPPAAQVLVETVAVAAGPLERSLAIEASGLSDFDPDLIANLERERLLRTTSSGGRVALEVYHDRIREMIEAAFDPEVLRGRHRAIARTLERREDRDVRAIFNHLRGAGDIESAAPYALLAGDQAAEQLAFDQAAYFYRATLEATSEAVDSASIWTRLADALANAGRGGESALAFGRAAEIAEDAGRLGEAMTLRRQSAEQFMLSGRLEDGIRVLRPLSERLGIRWPRSTGGALRGTLIRLPLLAWRYRRFVPRDDSEIADETRVAIDACQSATKGLLVVEPIPAAYFSVCGLLMALECGDLRRTGRALSAVGVALVPVGGPITAWAKQMLRRSVEIGQDTGDPYLQAVAANCEAEAFFVEGRWADMLESCDRGIEMLRTDCRGVRWECVAGDMAAMRALEELGRIPELKARLPHLLEEANELDDRYAQVTFRLYESFWQIAEGEPERARRTAREGLARWDQHPHHLQYLYACRIEAFCDVYEGRPERAWERVRETWPAIRKANLLRHPVLRTDAYLMRACTALALAESCGADASMLRVARRAAKQLERAGRDDSRAAAAMIRAGIAALRGEASESDDLLAKAEKLYRGAEMSLHALYAHRRRAQLKSGATGATQTEEADQLLRDLGMSDPERWLSVVAPGFGRAA